VIFSGMRLVGGQQLNAAQGDYSLIATLFDRLPREVKHTVAVPRIVGFEGFLGAEDRVRFLGIEVEKIEDIPEGMVAWDMNDTTWTVLQTVGDRVKIVWKEGITWLWSGSHGFEVGRTTGEFLARGPVEWRRRGNSEAGEFLLFANLFIDTGRSGFSDDINLVDYDPSWPGQFEEMASFLRERLGPDIALRIEHYGSTAIPGMPAKPVIDILVEIPSFGEGKKAAIPRLIEETWEYWWYSGHMVFFKRKTLMGERTHHVHMAPAGHEIWKGIAFRDFLRIHPEEARSYAALKQELAVFHRADRELYTEAKTGFVREVTSKALKKGM
jgi:GrpB-like predicted nucleotidyltransferase (UPF0157 family)